jgi:CHASE3 domain sensor protein
MKLKLPTLTKTQKIFASFAIIVVISFLVWGCGTAATTEVKTDSTHTDTTRMDTTLVDTLKK